MKNLLAIFFLSVFIFGFSSKKSEIKPEGKIAKEDLIWVIKSDESKQCEGQGTALEQAKQEAEASGIKVYDIKKSDDQMMHIQVCGASTGSTNALQISKSDLKKAEAIGFKEQKL